MKQYKTSIFIFRRDYRLTDNTGLIKALKLSETVVPCFIFTPEQLIDNDYKSNNCVQFMIESLEDLDSQLNNKGSRLFYFFDDPVSTLKDVIKDVKIDAMFVNMDYTPYSKRRDSGIRDLCEKNNIMFHSIEDALLQPVGTILNGSKERYSKFTPFFNTAKKIKVRHIEKNKFTNYYGKDNKIKKEFKGDIHQFYKKNPDLAVHGGRNLAKKILGKIDIFKNYNKERNIVAKQTTRLSAYIKFGCVSIREVYYKIKEELGGNDLIKQLYWREFYYHVGDANTEKIEKKLNFKSVYDKVPWITYKTATETEKKMFHAWCDGMTGFPIVDAGMRQLNTTGFMENRTRLIVASFLVKDMFWTPFDGDKYFSQNLVDIDLIVNCGSIGNWAWVSGGGTDTQPFFRVFSPVKQSMKYDPECIYIKRWIPELKDVLNDHIHQWDQYYEKYPNVKYPKPILDHSKMVDKAVKKYKKALYN